MASFSTLGPAGEQIFGTNPNISDVLARYFGSPSVQSTVPQSPAATTGSTTGTGTGLGGPEHPGLGTPLGNPLGQGTPGTGFGSDSGVAGEASGFAGRNTAADPSLMGSLALAAGIMPGGLGLPFGGALMGLGLEQFGMNPLTGTFLGGSPFDVAGPSLTQAQVQSVIDSISGLPPNTPRVTVMNTLNSALQAARSQANAPAGIDASGGSAQANAALVGRGSGYTGGGGAGAGGISSAGGSAQANAAGVGRGSGFTGGGGGGNPGGTPGGNGGMGGPNGAGFGN
jgi:hypothetical protein